MDDTSDFERRNRRYAIGAWLLLFWLVSPCLLLLIPLFHLPPGRWISVLGWWWLFGSGWLMFLGAGAQLITAIRSVSWPATEGTVREFAPGSYSPKTDASPTMMQYEYSVYGQTYIGGDAIPYRGGDWKNAYKPGDKVRVYYDPDKPWQSRGLSRGEVRNPFFLMLLGLVIIAVCLAVAISAA